MNKVYDHSKMKSALKIFNNKKKFSILIAILVLIILLCGLFTDLRFSDEIFHFWFAKDWYITGERPVYNELLHTVPEHGYYHYYLSVPLWHYGLKSIFNLSGGISKNLAQVYMAVWYILLIYGTYLLAKTIYDEQLGLYSAFVVATMPFIVSFSILFFIDVPIAAVTPYLIYFVIKRRYILAGIIMGLMFLLKENSYFLFPSACLLLLFNFHSKQPVKLSKRFLQVMLFSVLVLFVTLPNFKFRLDNFHGLLVPHDKGAIFATVGKLFKTSYLSIHDMLKPESPRPKVPKPVEVNYLTSSLTSFPIFFKYFGLLFPLLFLWRIISIFKYKDFHKKEFFLVIPILIYIPFYLIAFRGWWEIRYLSPIIPLLCIFSVRGIRYLKPWIRSIIVVVGLMMFLSTIVFTYIERRITLPEKGIMELIKQLPDGRILTPEPLISFYTGRPKVWTDSFRYTPGMGLYELFWDDSNIKKENILKDYKIKYILIPYERIYDDTKVRHFGGYPKSFVERLPKLFFVRLVFDNKDMSIWQVE